jgi:hypothetical protein
MLHSLTVDAHDRYLQGVVYIIVRCALGIFVAGRGKARNRADVSQRSSKSGGVCEKPSSINHAHSRFSIKEGQTYSGSFGSPFRFTSPLPSPQSISWSMNSTFATFAGGSILGALTA